MSLIDYLLFLPACFALNMAFGPNNLLSVTYGAQYGAAVATRAGLGRLVAFAPMLAISGLGMGALLMASATAFGVMKWVGVVYLVWLGLRIWRSPVMLPTATMQSSDGARPEAAPPLRALARQEFSVAISNPKAILIMTAFLPQFIPANASYALSYTEISVTFLLLEIVAIWLYALLGARMARIAAGGGRHTQGLARWFNRVSGGVMLLFAAVLAFARRPV